MENELVVREVALDDRIALWEWRNDSVTRKTFNLDQSVKYAEHCEWFEGLIKDSNRILCIGLVDTLRIGCVRFDLGADGNYETNLYLKPSYLGRGYGPGFLRKSVKYLAGIRCPRAVYAQVKKINYQSINILENAGFILMTECDIELHFQLDF